MLARSLTLALTLCASSLAQQELYLLGRHSRVYRVEGWQGPDPEVVPLVTYAGLGGGAMIHPITSDLLVLKGHDGDPTDPTEIWATDLSTGAHSLVCTLPSGHLWGLDQRWDGTIFSLRNREELVRIDLATCSLEVTPLSTALPAINEFGSPLTVDHRGMLVTRGEGRILQIDPISGEVIPTQIPHPEDWLWGFAESTADGTLLLGGLTSRLDRRDPISGIWEGFFGNALSVPGNIWGLAFTEPADGRGFYDICEGFPNSTGMHATLELIGTNQVADADLELASRRVPPGSFGYYITGPNAGLSQVGSGQLCIAQPLYRFVNDIVVADPMGTVRMPVDLSSIPGHGTVTPGDSLVFQLWYRDGPTTNFSSAVRVVFE